MKILYTMLGKTEKYIGKKTEIFFFNCKEKELSEKFLK